METTEQSFETRLATAEDAAALAGLLEELGFPASLEVVAKRLATLGDGGETVMVGVRGVEVLHWNGTPIERGARLGKAYSSLSAQPA